LTHPINRAIPAHPPPANLHSAGIAKRCFRDTERRTPPLAPAQVTNRDARKGERNQPRRPE
jgi:hypothetical protein